MKAIIGRECPHCENSTFGAKVPGVLVNHLLERVYFDDDQDVYYFVCLSCNLIIFSELDMYEIIKESPEENEWR
jgi:hypothetical protein